MPFMKLKRERAGKRSLMLVLMAFAFCFAQGVLTPTYAFSVANQATPISNETLLQLRMTHTFYASVFAGYLNEGDQKYRPRYMATKQYILTFLNRWSELIETARYSSTGQIFAAIKNSETYLGLYYPVWEGLHSPKHKYFTNLGGAKNSFLTGVWHSENAYRDPEERLTQLLKLTNALILASSKDYVTSEVIATAFSHSKNPKIREQADALTKGKPFQTRLSVLVSIRDLMVPTRFAFGLAAPQKAVSQIKTSANMLRSLNPSRKLNPFLKNIPKMYWAGAGSVAFHGGLFYVLDRQKKNRDTQKQVQDTLLEEIGSSIEFALMNLWENIYSQNAEVFSSFNKDFVPRYRQASKKELVTSIKNYLLQPRSQKGFDYLTAFVQAEKVKSIDRRKLSDLFAIHFMHGQMEVFTREISEYLRVAKQEKQPAIVQIETIRQILIDGYLARYSRDYPSLTSTFLGWGGNCISRTMLFVGVFERLKDQIPLPDQMKLGIVSFIDHIEPVLYNGEEIWFLIDGQKRPFDNARIWKPEFLLHALLTDFSEADSLTLSSALATGQLDLSEEKVNSSPQGTKTKKLETILPLDMNIPVTWKGLPVYSLQDPAEFAMSSYHPLYLADSSSGFGASNLSGLGASSQFPSRRHAQKRTGIELKISLSRDKRSSGAPFDIVSSSLHESVDGLVLGGRMEINTYSEKTYSALTRIKRYGSQPTKLIPELLRYLLREIEQKIESTSLIEILLNARTLDETLLLPESQIKTLSESTDCLRFHCEFSILRLLLFKNSKERKIADPNSNEIERLYPESKLVQAIKLFDSMRSSLAEEAAQSPARFLQLMSEAPEEHFLHFMKSPYGSSGEQLVREYFRDLKRVHITNPRVGCHSSDITLPVSKHPLGPQRSARSCLDNQAEEKRKDTDLSSQDLRVSAKRLIILTVNFGVGLHLWTPETVDLFISGNLGVPRDALKHLNAPLMKIFEDYPNKIYGPHHEKLRRFLEQEIEKTNKP